MALTEVGGPPPMPRPDELENAVVHQLDELDQPAEAEGWRIEDEGSADWCLRKLVKLRAQMAEIDATATRQIQAIYESIAPFVDPISQWRAEQTDKLTAEATHWEWLLTEYHRSVLSVDPEAISIQRAHGTLKSRKLPDKWEFDEGGFLVWAKANAPELVRVKEEIDKATAKKFLKVDDDNLVTMAGIEGYVPDVTVHQGERKFEVATEVPL